MKKNMNVAIMNGIHDISFIEREIPTIKEDEVLIALEYVGVCGSDLHYYEHGAIGDYIVKPPFVLGHEAAGEVVAIGNHVTHVNIGDRVAIEPQKTCGTCVFCKSGRYNLCKDVAFFATPPIDGVFQEYVAFPENLCFPLPSNVSTLEGALMEPLAVGFHAATQGEVKAGNQVIVMGAGCIGLVSMMACLAMGVTDIVVVDVEDLRLQKAKELGVRWVINPMTCNLEEEIAKITKDGFDVAIETAGNEITTRQCIQYCKKGANIVLVGYSKSGEMTLPISLAMDKEITFKTVFRYRNNYPTIIQAVASGLVNLKDLATAIYPFDQVKQALEDSIYNKKEIVKSVIKIK